MLIEKSIVLLKEFARQKEDKEFIEFASNLSLFLEKHKQTYNVNDFHIFVNLVEKNTNQSDEMALKTAISSISLAKECTQNGFVDYEKFYNNFKDYMIGKEARVKDNEIIFIEDNQISKPNQESLINELNNSKNLNDANLQTNLFIQELEKLVDLSKDSQNKTLEIQKIKELQNDEFYFSNTQEERANQEQPNFDELISFIHDKEQIHYPFSKEATLNNHSFMSNLYANLKKLSHQQIQKLVDELRAKNEALRNEIQALDTQKINITKELKEELTKNYKLTTLQEIDEKNTLEKISTDKKDKGFKQENYKKYRKK
ncbi:hypothetical protein [Helicobacter sp. MIT 14-3879]|uniref:hypothetical protein n=1 Tax=Helicobacter sp. MIT 14-3879 TaxID=2040649 RepID=UPI000E1E3DF2|nr:hypothetical protein [Helicobacter sp. MIT 14-3879]RDU61485.1 hypothetical protein CQA44_08730 [Helicobacter sp. MIT 14-3879]